MRNKQVEMIDPDLNWKFMQHIPYCLWKFINLIEWTLWFPLQSHIQKDFSYGPFDCQTGFEIWKVIHEK